MSRTMSLTQFAAQYQAERAKTEAAVFAERFTCECATCKAGLAPPFGAHLIRRLEAGERQAMAHAARHVASGRLSRCQAIQVRRLARLRVIGVTVIKAAPATR